MQKIYIRLAERLPTQAVIELLCITFLGLVFYSQVVHLAPDKSAAGVEHERLTGLVLAAEVGLARFEQIPSWNPHMGIGEPLLNNPFNYLFNPFLSGPILLFGGVQGSKIAIGFGLLLAGYSMWAFSRVLGLGGAARISAAALYMMSGGISGKFHPGHFQLGLSLAYPPLVFAGLWWVLHSRDRRAPILTAIAFALMFFAGNVYYTLHTLLCCAVILAFHLVEKRKIRFDRLRRVLTSGIFVFGLSALQFIPIWSIQDYIGGHPGDSLLTNNYGLEQVVKNFITTWHDWQLTMPESLLVSVDYNYLGAAAFMPLGAAALLLLVNRAAWRWCSSKTMWLALVLAVLMMIWGAGQHPLVRSLYAEIPFLAQFRFVGRAHAVAALWWIVLIAFAINILWKSAASVLRTNPAFATYDRIRLVRAAGAAGLVWLTLTIIDAHNLISHLPYEDTLAGHIDTFRFGYLTYSQEILPRLWMLLLAAVLIDTALLALEQLVPFGRRSARAYGVNLQAFGTRLLRVLLLLLLIAMLADILKTNATVYQYSIRRIDMTAAYNYARITEPNDPIPAINEPNFENYAFDAYYHQTRRWSLNEGWVPLALPTIVRSEGLADVSPWVLVLNPQHPTIREYELAFQQCGIQWQLNTDYPCDAVNEVPALLYRSPKALPYAFIAPLSNLIHTPRTLTPSSVGRPRSVIHTQDRITIIAEMPVTENQTPYFLVIQETHFPGWTGYINGAAVQTVSIGRYIGIPMLPGLHTYHLRYDSPGLTSGILLFIITLGGIWLYLKRE